MFFEFLTNLCQQLRLLFFLKEEIFYMELFHFPFFYFRYLEGVGRNKNLGRGAVLGNSVDDGEEFKF